MNKNNVSHYFTISQETDHLLTKLSIKYNTKRSGIIENLIKMAHENSIDEDDNLIKFYNSTKKFNIICLDNYSYRMLKSTAISEEKSINQKLKEIIKKFYI
jgi:hypothetical protein